MFKYPLKLRLSKIQIFLGCKLATVQTHYLPMEKLCVSFMSTQLCLYYSKVIDSTTGDLYVFTRLVV